MRYFATFIIILSLLGIAHADSYHNLSHEYDLTFQQFLREKLIKFHKHDTVVIYLKTGKVVRGTFEGYQKYDDSIWIMPLNKHGLFADCAYDISELQDIRLIVIGHV